MPRPRWPRATPPRETQASTPALVGAGKRATVPAEPPLPRRWRWYKQTDRARGCGRHQSPGRGAGPSWRQPISPRKRTCGRPDSHLRLSCTVPSPVGSGRKRPALLPDGLGPTGGDAIQRGDASRWESTWRCESRLAGGQQPANGRGAAVAKPVAAHPPAGPRCRQCRIAACPFQPRPPSRFAVNRVGRRVRPQRRPRGGANRGNEPRRRVAALYARRPRPRARRPPPVRRGVTRGGRPQRRRQATSSRLVTRWTQCPLFKNQQDALPG